jgi:hypothetical protein
VPTGIIRSISSTRELNGDTRQVEATQGRANPSTRPGDPLLKSWVLCTSGCFH